jgi:hypothetical protein
MNTIVVIQICCNPFVNLWTSYLYNKQASSKTLKSHPLSKNYCSSSSLHRDKKTQINPTIYCTYGSKKKQTQTFPYYYYANKKK